MLTSNPIGRAVRYALLTGAATSIAAPIAVQAQQNEENITEVVVTGSRIRRVDAETASPVFTYDTEAIERSGVTTLGDLITRIPAISGAATNPQVNNGGGNGDTNIELRGLSPERTLVLLNGRRVGPVGYTTSAVDINMIPINMIERVEVLKQGAGAVYGSDAIAGVVNFITKKASDGAEVGLEYGITGEDDGEKNAISLSIGAVGERSSIMIGANYNKQESVGAGDRIFSANAMYLYNGAVYGITFGGSSRAPNGRINLRASQYNSTFGCPVNSAGEISVIRREGAAGSALADYRCFVTGGDSNDFYNFQPKNLIMTPQERGSLFTIANYEINDNIDVYTELLYTRTSSGYAIAPLPFDVRQDDIIIAPDSQSLYNPFEQSFGGIDATFPNALWRLEALGNRRNDVSSDASQAHVGVRGEIMDSGWDYDATVSYGRVDMDRRYQGYLFQSALQPALGPSFIDASGQPTCGTPAAPIRNCTPVNIFNLEAPGQSQALSTISAPYTDSYQYQSKAASLNVNGTAFELPAGALQLAAGYEYRELNGVFNTDFNTELLPPLFLTCLLSSEACSASSRGGYDVSEFYAEFFVPLLKDLPAVSALNLSAGVRYSDYSTFGDTTNASFAVEYRPIPDLLVRASYAEVFRAPTVYNLFHGPAKDAPTFNDPCTGLTNAAVAANPNLALACVGVPRTGNFTQPNSQVDGIWLSNDELDAETGDVFTYGLVYEPNWLSGLSLTLDFWDYKIEDSITRIDPNYAADNCVATGQAEFCNLISRNADGTILVIREPYVNLGTLETSGIDFGFRYTLQDTGIGSFRFSMETTYTDKYDNTPAPGAETVEIAGLYDRQFGNYAQWRGLASVGWALGGADALVTTRYIDSIKLTDPDGMPGVQPDLEIGSITYIDLTLGYTLPTQTRFQAGILNLQDKQPPILYQNNVTNANTDVQTYDTVGRQFFVSVTQKF
jgi:iron complex outermembrane receptor protein